jgi:hypothetical protein
MIEVKYPQAFTNSTSNNSTTGRLHVPWYLSELWLLAAAAAHWDLA